MVALGVGPEGDGDAGGLGGGGDAGGVADGDDLVALAVHDEEGAVAQAGGGVGGVEAGGHQHGTEDREHIARDGAPAGEGGEAHDGADAFVGSGGIKGEDRAEADAQHADAGRVDIGAFEEVGECGAGVLGERGAAGAGVVGAAVAPVIEQQDVKTFGGEEVGEGVVETDIAGVAVGVEDGGGGRARGDIAGGHEPGVEADAVLGGDPDVLVAGGRGEGAPRGVVGHGLDAAGQAGHEQRQGEHAGERRPVTQGAASCRVSAGGGFGGFMHTPGSTAARCWGGGTWGRRRAGGAC